VERVGVFGGTFDPVHVGHLVAASWCKEVLHMDLVLLVAANEPWQKAGTRDLTPAEERFEVLRAAVEGFEGLEASRLEIDRGGPSYTADTLRDLGVVYPDAELFLVVGSDVAGELRTWERFGELEGMATLAVVDRGGTAREADPVRHWGWKGPVEHVRIPTIGVSSSDLRERLESGLTVDFLIPEPAIRRIRALGLYAVGR
jgi:nicotinate-nucleotide adenylyltransferase